MLHIIQTHIWICIHICIQLTEQMYENEKSVRTRTRTWPLTPPYVFPLSPTQTQRERDTSANLVTASLCTMENDKSFCIYLPEKFHIILVPFHRMQCFPIHIIFTWYFDFVSEVDNVRHLNIYRVHLERENEMEKMEQKYKFMCSLYFYGFSPMNISNSLSFFAFICTDIFCNCSRKNCSIYFKLHFRYLPVKCIPWIVWQPTENEYRKNIWVSK